ncbi:accessory gene regulator B family protein [Peptostreptococcaceae bacterium AGR-M142]
MSEQKLSKQTSSRIMKKIAKLIEVEYESDEIQVAEYSVEAFLMNLYKLPIIFGIAYFLGIFKESIFVYVIMAIMRGCAWGVHLKTSTGCLIFTMCYIYINIYISKSIAFNWILVIVLLVGGFINYYKYAPADTEDRPCLDTNLRQRMWKKTIFLFSVINIFNLMVFKLYNYTEIFYMVLISIFFVSLMIHPLMYRIFDRGYRNYEKYS